MKTLTRNILPFNLKIFYGFQFVSDKFQVEELHNTVKESCQIAELKLKDFIKDIKLDPQQFNIVLGDLLHIDMRVQIEDSWICIFEISDRNPNVFYEVGFAIGKEKIVILLVSSTEISNVPSDLQGVIYLVYNENNINAIKDGLAKHIISKFEEVLLPKSSSVWFWEHIKFNEFEVYTGRTEADNFTLADMTALDILRKNLGINASLKLNFNKNINGKDLKQNIISFGGPKKNEVSKTILELFNGKNNLSLEPDLINGHFKIYDKAKNLTYLSDISPALPEEKVDYSQRNGKEYGLIYKFSNPYKEKTNWFVFAGINREGTIASIEAIFSKNILGQIAKLADYNTNHIEILIECDVLKGKSIGESIVEVYTFQ